MKPRKIGIVMAFVGILVLLGASTAFPQKKVTLTIWQQDPSDNEWIQGEAKIFSQQRGDIELSIKNLVIPGKEQPTKFLSVLATGDRKLLPDMIIPQHFEFARFIRAGVEDEFIDLRPYLEPELSNYPSYEMWMYDDAIYGVNVSICAVVYYYNKELMDRVGIDPREFVSYDDFIEAGKKLRNATGAYMTPMDIATWNQFQILWLQNGGGIFDKDGNVILDKPETIEALELYKRLLDEEIAFPVSSFYGPGTRQAYIDEVVAGCIMADWYLGAILTNIPELKGKWRIAALPVFKPGGSRTSKRGGSAYHILKNSPNAEVALEFWKFLCMTPEPQVRRFVKLSKFPNYKPSLQDPIVLEFENDWIGGQKAAQVYLDIFDEVPRYYHGPYIAEAFDILNAEVMSQVVNNELTPVEALTVAAKKLREAMGQ